MNTKEELPPPASEEKEGGLGLMDEYTSFTFFFYMGNITSHWRFGFWEKVFRIFLVIFSHVLRNVLYVDNY